MGGADSPAAVGAKQSARQPRWGTDRAGGAARPAGSVTAQDARGSVGHMLCGRDAGTAGGSQAVARQDAAHLSGKEVRQARSYQSASEH